MKTLDIARDRLQNEHLIGARLRRPEAVVRWLCAVQAQDYSGAKWAIGQRVENCVAADVEQAYASGKILRTHIMRPTWHFVTPADIRWMLALTAPRVHAACSYYYRRLELDRATFRRSDAALAKALRGGRQLTRAELAAVLRSVGIEASGPRFGFLLMHAELEAVICSGVPRGKQHTYALFDERVPQGKALRRDEALRELTRRYFASHGPSLVRDFAWWSGLTITEAKASVESASPPLRHAEVDGKTYWFIPSRTTAKLKNPAIHLLPNYDEYLVAYRDHGPSLDERVRGDAGAFYDVLSRHIVVLNGKVVGGWRSMLTKEGARIETALLVPLDEEQSKALHAAARDYGRFLGKSVDVIQQQARPLALRHNRANVAHGEGYGHR